MSELETPIEIEKFVSTVRKSLTEQQAKSLQGSLVMMVDELGCVVSKPKKSKQLKKYIRHLKDMIVLSSLVLGFEWEDAIVLASDYNRMLL